MVFYKQSIYTDLQKNPDTQKINYDKNKQTILIKKKILILSEFPRRTVGMYATGYSVKQISSHVGRYVLSVLQC